MEEHTNTTLLLDEVSKIVKADKEIQDERRAKGEKFNIFYTLKLYSEEVTLHSRVLAELLSAKGRHGVQDAFLKAFIATVEIEDLGFDTLNAKVSVERNIGEITDENGGRVDIIIESVNNKAIIIENKIYAGDQKNQMLRYYNYAETKYKKGGYKLIYLNLFGSPPCVKSTNGLGDETYTVISYRDEIVSWLSKCIEISARQPLVRETIVQYLSVIKHLTHQNMDSKLSKKLIGEITKNRENFISAMEIDKQIDSAKDHLMRTTFLDSLKILTTNNGIKGEWSTIQNKKLYDKYSGFLFTPEGWHKFYISFQFQQKNFRTLRKGIRANNNIEIDSSNEDIIKIREVGYSKRSKTWVCLDLHGSQSWGATEFYQIYNPDSSLYQKIIESIEHLIRQTESIKM